jgi:hypothetical protein
MTTPRSEARKATKRASSPLVRFLASFDRLDADGCAALFAEHGRLRFADGRVERGQAAVRECLEAYFGDLRSTEHVLREQWGSDPVWIGEVVATYVLADHSLLAPVSKVFIVRTAGDGIEDLRVFAAGEPSFHEATVRHERERHRGIHVGGRRLPPL